LPKSEWILHEISHVPIIEETTFEKAQELLKVKRLDNRAKNDDYILSGLLYCKTCEKYRHR
jgi:hypothetical protein